MAAGLAAALANSFLNAIGNAANVTAPAACYIQLHTGDPGAAGTSNVASETDRVQASFGAAASGAITNDAAVSWASVAATETYTHVSAWDASTAGTFLFSDALAASVAVTAGDDFELAAGDIDLSFTPIAA